MVMQYGVEFASIPIQEVLNTDRRLEAGSFKLSAKKLKDKIAKMPVLKAPLSGEEGLTVAYHCPRFKRPYVTHGGLDFYQPAQIKEVNPSPARQVAAISADELAHLKVKKNQLLLTCSGTIGDVAFVSDKLHNQIFSHDLIRLEAKDQRFTGYLFSFIRSKLGRSLVTTSTYGAVIQHIEPSHLENVQIPLPSEHEISWFSETYEKAKNLINESNTLFDKCVKAVESRCLGQEPFSVNTTNALDSFTVPLASLQNRFDANYHNSRARGLLDKCKRNGITLKTLAKSGFVEQVRRPTQFKRVYVGSDFGIPFFTGKSIGELFPSDIKFLSKTEHKSKISELTLKPDQILITRSGTIGNVAMVPEHWARMCITDDIIIIEPRSKVFSGYVWAWLASTPGKEAMLRFSYGAVVQHIEDSHIEQLPIPILDNSTIESIGESMIRVNVLRSQAHALLKESELKVDKFLNDT